MFTKVLVSGDSKPVRNQDRAAERPQRAIVYMRRGAERGAV